METEKRLIDANEYPCNTCDISYCYKNCDKFNAWLENTVDAVEVVRCSYCDPGGQDYNPCWLCKKGGTAHDVEHCHKTNYGDYEPMQPHCHLCGRKL